MAQKPVHAAQLLPVGPDGSVNLERIAGPGIEVDVTGVKPGAAAVGDGLLFADGQSDVESRGGILQVDQRSVMDVNGAVDGEAAVVGPQGHDAPLQSDSARASPGDEKPKAQTQETLNISPPHRRVCRQR